MTATVDRAMKVREVCLRPVVKRITWWQAAETLRISDHSMRAAEPANPIPRGQSNIAGQDSVNRLSSGPNIRGRSDSDRVQPGLDKLRPGGDRQPGVAEAVAVSALGIDMHFGGHFGFLQGHEVDDGVFDMDRIILGLEDETGRGFARHRNVGIKCEVLVCKRKVSGIDDHSEVGTAAQLVSGIHRIVQALIEVRAKGGGKMGSGGEAEDANAMRVNVPIIGMRAHDAEGALGVLERGG